MLAVFSPPVDTEETEAQRGRVTCSKSHSRFVAGARPADLGSWTFSITAHEPLLTLLRVGMDLAAAVSWAFLLNIPNSQGEK